LFVIQNKIVHSKKVETTMRQNMKRVMQGLLALVFTFVLAAGLQVGPANAQFNCLDFYGPVYIEQGEVFECQLPQTSVLFDVKNLSTRYILTFFAEWGSGNKGFEIRPNNPEGEKFVVEGDGSIMSMNNESDEDATAFVTIRGV